MNLDDIPAASRSVVDPAGRRFRPVRSAAWLATATLAGVLLAAVSVRVGHIAAPLLIFPLLVSCVLAAVLVLTLRLCGVADRKTALAGAVLAAIVLAGARHWISYVDARRDAHVQQQKLATAAAAAFPELAGKIVEPPRSFPEFLHISLERGISLGGRHYGSWMVWLLWSLDAAIPLGVTLLVVSIALRQPYCDKCGTWFRTTRRGRIDRETATALAQALSSQSEPAPAAYRL